MMHSDSIFMHDVIADSLWIENIYLNGKKKNEDKGENTKKIWYTHFTVFIVWQINVVVTPSFLFHTQKKSILNQFILSLTVWVVFYASIFLKKEQMISYTGFSFLFDLDFHPSVFYPILKKNIRIYFTFFYFSFKILGNKKTIPFYLSHPTFVGLLPKKKELLSGRCEEIIWVLYAGRAILFKCRTHLHLEGIF